MRGLVVLFAFVACQAGEGIRVDEEQSALIGGDVTTGDPAVVALQTGGGFPFCTGTLVSPSVVATAAHCVDMAGNDPAVVIYFGSDAQNLNTGRRISTDRKWQNPNWTGNLSGGNDIALILMAFPNFDVEPIPLIPDVPVVGESLRRVGFGIYNQEGDSDGLKRQGTVEIAQFSGDVLISDDSTVTTCSGDSGGPAFVVRNGEEVLAGVHSFGLQNNGVCVGGSDGSTRVDLYLEQMQNWIDANDPVCGKDWSCSTAGCTNDPDCGPCGANGECESGCALPDPDCPTAGPGEICQIDAQCMDGICVPWSGDPQRKFCAPSCSSDNDCPSEMSCQDVQGESRCFYTSAPSGVVGDSCESAEECGSYLCNEGQCVTECDVSKGVVCPFGFTCTAAVGPDGGDAFYCIKDVNDEGCCNSSEPSLPALIFALAAIIGMCRQRKAPQLQK